MDHRCAGGDDVGLAGAELSADSRDARALRGKSFTVLEVIYCGDPADGPELVAPLRELGNVGMDTVQPNRRLVSPSCTWTRLRRCPIPPSRC